MPISPLVVNPYVVIGGVRTFVRSGVVINLNAGIYPMTVFGRAVPVRVRGYGGGGGGCPVSAGGGSGGGGGAYVAALRLTLQPGKAYTIAVGPGGAVTNIPSSHDGQATSILEGGGVGYWLLLGGGIGGGNGSAIGAGGVASIGVGGVNGADGFPVFGDDGGAGGPNGAGTGAGAGGVASPPTPAGAGFLGGGGGGASIITEGGVGGDGFIQLTF